MWLVKFIRLFSSLVQMKNIIDVSPPNPRVARRRCQHVLSEVRHEEASIGWSHACAHSGPMYLEMVFAQEGEIVLRQYKFHEVGYVTDGRGRVPCPG